MFARNASDMKMGGIDAGVVASRFAGRGGIEDAYTGAVKTLNTAIGSLPKEMRSTVFEDGNLWFSVEVIHSGAQNVIGYDTNSVIFHSEGAKRIDKTGNIMAAQNVKGSVATLERSIDAMQLAVSDGWRVRKDEPAALKKMADGTSLASATRQIDLAAARAGGDDSMTLGELVRSHVENRVQSVMGGFMPGLQPAIIDRIVGTPGSNTMTQLKKAVGPEASQMVQMLIDGASDMTSEAIQPIESAIIGFSIDALRGVASAYMLDPESSRREAERISAEVSQAVELIRARGTPAAIRILDTQLRRLGDLTNAGISLEGIVFRYKGKTFKLTAGFGPVNQILGLFKYGRGAAAPPIPRD